MNLWETAMEDNLQRRLDDDRIVGRSGTRMPRTRSFADCGVREAEVAVLDDPMAAWTVPR